MFKHVSNFNHVRLKKLTDNQKKKMDINGWSAIFSLTEREKAHTVFDLLHIAYPISFENNNTDLYLILDSGIEVGRLSVFNDRDKNEYALLDDIIIYEPFRGKGIFKCILNILRNNYRIIRLYTANEYLINSLSKSSTFKHMPNETKTYIMLNDTICFQSI